MEFFLRYVAENIETPARKTKETDSNLKGQKKCKSDQDFKLNSFKIQHGDLKKPVPDISISDENLTPPVLEPVYSDIKVKFFFKHTSRKYNRLKPVMVVLAARLVAQIVPALIMNLKRPTP